MNIEDILIKSSKTLMEFNINNPYLDSELLLSKALNISREDLLLNLKKKISFNKHKKFNILLKKRERRMPVAYILGYKDFWKSKF